MSGFRLAHTPADAASIDRARPLDFTFDGQPFRGFSGDTLASALLANGVDLVSRSFKLHRPRGIMGVGAEDPNALVTLRAEGVATPNVPATTIELTQGLTAESQNRWPSLRFDVLSINGAIARFLPAGFYYKTFMWPASFWEKVYEPAIRRAAGLGNLGSEPDTTIADTMHHHCDILVVGSGVAGLATARTAAGSGARLLMLEQDFVTGGGTRLEPALAAWRGDCLAAVDPACVLTRTTCVAAYSHGVFAAVERIVTPGEVDRLRLHIIRTKASVLATGATDRLIAFPGNDRPGVMSADAVRTYASRFAVAPGRRVALFANNDAAYATAHALAARGVEIAAVIDPRAATPAADAARKAGLRVETGSEVFNTSGRLSLRAIHVRRRDGAAATMTFEVDTLAMSGGCNPNVQLASQAGLKLTWHDATAAFIPVADDGTITPAGAACGIVGAGACARDGALRATRVLASLGFRATPTVLPDMPPDIHAPLLPLWEVRGRGKAFVDLQNDVTTDDVRLAHQEGYSHVEHMKRYTTHSMATDQGKTAGLVGAAVLAEARGVAVAEVGLPTFRPYVQGVPWAALGGADVGLLFKPERRLPLHDWHAGHGAVFTRIGLWLRPLVYSPTGDTSWGPVLAEARAVRASVGLTDVSSLGKIDVQGPDAAVLLDRLYANTFSTLPVGRARYGLMLREDGMVFDDGTTARLAADHFLVTTTTQKADDVLAHMEWYHQTVWQELDVSLTNVADHWAQFAVAGPRARDLLAKVIQGVDLDNAALPFMGVTPATIAGVAGRLFRISFSGELAYEVAVPARYAQRVWTALLDTGKPYNIGPYGLDALNVLRVEKGHVTGVEINGQTTADDLGLGRMLKASGDFVGRALATREGLRDPRRLQLVGLRATVPEQRIRGGAHLVVPGASESQGFVTSPCLSAALEGWIALGLLAGGRSRIGETVIATNPVFGEDTPVMVVSPHMVDPEGRRVRV